MGRPAYKSPMRKSNNMSTSFSRVRSTIPDPNPNSISMTRSKSIRAMTNANSTRKISHNQYKEAQGNLHQQLLGI